MRKPIPRPIHGVLDYLYGASIAAAPTLLKLEDEARTATLFCRIVGAGTIAAALLTRYELGAIRVLPFKFHLLGDVLTGLTALAAPFAFGFSENKKAKTLALGFGALALVVAALSQSDEMKTNDV